MPQRRKSKSQAPRNDRIKFLEWWRIAMDQERAALRQRWMDILTETAVYSQRFPAIADALTRQAGVIADEFARLGIKPDNWNSVIEQAELARIAMEASIVSMDETRVVFTGDKLASVLDAMKDLTDHRDRVTSLQIAYDDIDKGIKFKVDNYPWSPPYTA